MQRPDVTLRAFWQFVWLGVGSVKMAFCRPSRYLVKQDVTCPTEYYRRRIAMAYDYSRDFRNIDFRKHPDLYRIGRGEQGVLLVEPYKSEILPHWRFKTPDLARRSAEKIYHMFLAYEAEGDFVGMDMARKFLQMGYTRARRYANHKSGRKYEAG